MTINPQYLVVLRPLSREDGGGWVASVPDLPGCMSDGETALESLANVEGAIEEWKDAAMAMAAPFPRRTQCSVASGLRCPSRTYVQAEATH